MINPRLKLAIKERISQFLYSDPLTKLRKDLEYIITTNDQLSNKGHYMFTYRGVRYKWYENMPLVWGPLPLHQSLHKQMDQYIKETKELAEESALTLGYIQNILNKSDNPEDYLRLIPSALHVPIHELLAQFPDISKTLSLTDAEKLIKTHARSVDLIKQRLMLNLLYKT